MLNVGVLYATQSFLEGMERAPLGCEEFERNFPRYELISSRDVLNTAERCKWIELGDPVRLTGRGRSIVVERDYRIRLRMQIRDVFLYTPPSWSGLLKQGRNAISSYVGANALQCFIDAGLLDDGDPEIASWWDGVASPFWDKSEIARLPIGRKGEWLSLKFEEQRVQQTPGWIALNDNSAGYDLLSVIDRGNTGSLLVEVKASTQDWDDASFYMSRHEWVILSSACNAAVHLWSLATSQPRHRVLKIDELRPHIPEDKGAGEWQKVRLAFRVFKNKTAKE